MSEEFDRELRASLQARADQTAHVDLADGALRRAGRIRTRRRVISGVGVLAAVALAVPVAAHLVASSTDHTASKPVDDPTGPVSITLTGMSQGPAPQVPYIDGQTFRTPERAIELPVTRGQVTDAVGVSEGALIWTRDHTTGKTRVESVAGAAPAAETLELGSDATSPTVSPRAGEVAWAADSGVGKPYRPSQVLVIKTADGQARGAGPTGESVLGVMGVADGSVIYNARAGKHTFVSQLNVSDGTSSRPWVDARYVTAVDGDLQRLAGRTGDEDDGCSTVIDRDAPEDGWETCDWRPVEFSTDGTLILAIPPDSDGLGPRELAVLNADDGQVRQVLTTEGTFGRATFEESTSVVAVLAQGDEAAIVRCGIESAECERATPTAQVAPDDPASLVAPYQLTAN